MEHLKTNFSARALRRGSMRMYPIEVLRVSLRNTIVGVMGLSYVRLFLRLVLRCSKGVKPWKTRDESWRLNRAARYLLLNQCSGVWLEQHEA